MSKVDVSKLKLAPPLVVESNGQSRKFQFHGFVTYGWIDHWRQDGLNAEEFALKLIGHLTHDATTDFLSWDDALKIACLQKLLPITAAGHPLSVVPTQALEEFKEFWYDFAEHNPGLIAGRQLVHQMKMFSLGFDNLKKAGFAFALELFEGGSLESYATIDPKRLSQTITRHMSESTRSEESQRSFLEEASSNVLLRKRVKIIAEAFALHNARRYIASVPLLISQVEGILTDYVVSEGLAVRRPNGKVFSSTRLDKKGRAVELVGLRSKIEESDFLQKEHFKLFKPFLEDEFAPRRNEILHGSVWRYDTAKESTRAVLALVIIMRQVMSPVAD